jgi:hypothetical protein
MVLGSVDIYVQFGPDVDPYFLILKLDRPVRWRRAWFLLRDDAVLLLPAFMGSTSSPIPSGVTVWIK